MPTWDTDELLQDNTRLHRENDTLKRTITELRKACRQAQAFVNWYRDMAIEGQIKVTEYGYTKRPLDRDGDYGLMVRLDAALEYARRNEPDLWGTVDLWGIGKDWVECSFCHKMCKPYNTSLLSDNPQGPIICKSCSLTNRGNGPNK